MTALWILTLSGLPLSVVVGVLSWKKNQKREAVGSGLLALMFLTELIWLIVR